jgi:hypothetical protein
MNLDMMQREPKPLAKQEIVLAAFLDDEERQLRAPLCYRSACPLGLAGLKTILREALLAQAASIEITLSAASEGLEEFLAEARALYQLANAAARAGIERVTLRRSMAEGRWLELRVRSGAEPGSSMGHLPAPACEGASAKSVSWERA